MRSDHLKEHKEKCKGDRADIISEYSDTSSRANDFDHGSQVHVDLANLGKRTVRDFMEPMPQTPSVKKNQSTGFNKLVMGEFSEDKISTEVAEEVTVNMILLMKLFIY